MSTHAFRSHTEMSAGSPATNSANAENDATRQSIDALDAEICTLARSLNAETHRLLVLVRTFDDRMGWAKWSFRNCAEWLAWRCGLSLSAAREKVRTAQALRELPAISAAFADGRLSYSKVRALTRVVEWHSEHALLSYALEATAAQVEDRCREIRNATPDSASVARRAWDRRALTLWRDTARGTMHIRVEVPLEDGELVAQALERAVAAGEAASGVEFAGGRGAARFNGDDGGAAESGGNGWRAQQADALVAIARAYLGAEPSAEGCGDGCDAHDDARAVHPAARASGASSSSTADRYQVVVHVSDEALRGGQGRADLPIDTLRRLTCDGSVVTVREDEHGTPLDIGRKQRTVSTALKRALWSRDRRCSFPGCHRTRYVDAHHIRHWADGGETSLENLTLLCSHHHRLLHEGGFTIRRDERGELYFRRPDGRVIPRQGYRVGDMCDDGGEPTNPSAEGVRYPPTRHAAAQPSAEVRETAGVYRLGWQRRCAYKASATYKRSGLPAH